jgi:hypothetical protein
MLRCSPVGLVCVTTFCLIEQTYGSIQRGQPNILTAPANTVRQGRIFLWNTGPTCRQVVNLGCFTIADDPGQTRDQAFVDGVVASG